MKLLSKPAPQIAVAAFLAVMWISMSLATGYEVVLGDIAKSIFFATHTVVFGNAFWRVVA